MYEGGAREYIKGWFLKPSVWQLLVKLFLEKEKATHSSILAWRIPWTIVHGIAKSRTWPTDFHSHSLSEMIIEDWKRLQFNKHLIEYLHMCVCVCSVVQSCQTLCDPMHCSPPGSPVHGILQARILAWVAISSSRGSSPPRDWTCIFCIGRKILYHWATESGKSNWILTMC